MKEKQMSAKPKGKLIIIGGAEEKHREGQMEILEEVSRHARKGNGRLVVVTVATQFPEELAETYTQVFNGLGISKIDVLDIRTRSDAQLEENVNKVKGASAIFFTGGDQLRITSQIGDSPVFQCMQERYIDGATIAGTSAGAAAMPETMLVAGPGDESNRLWALDMAPGLGFIKDAVIDSHFAERGRMGRLLGAVSQNPKNLGLGIDEDTAVYVQNQDFFEVLGSGAVYVVDGSGITFSSLSEKNAEGVLSVYDVKLHVLSRGDCFDLSSRQPTFAVKKEKLEAKEA
jgi:cyanophycinase